MQPLISVIVPVYKVEDCIVRCLDSLRRQSFTNIEILLIDDASPDNCGKICELYAEKDSRFRVIHNLTNQGLSVARNIGITNARCDWLMFVDSDDWVHKDYCKEAYECAIDYQADLVLFRFQRIKDPESFWAHDDKTDNFLASGYKNRLEAMELLHNVVGMAAWNKLYRKDLFEDICYPPGYLFEDEGTTYKFVWKAVRIYYLDKVLYYKYYHAGSITTLKTEKALHDLFEMSMQHYHDLAKWGYPSDKLEKLLINIAFNYCLKKKPDNSDANYVFCANALHNSNSFPSHFSWKLKLLFVLFKYCNPLFELICFLYGTKVS